MTSSAQQPTNGADGGRPLNGRVAVITGAASGLGEAIARRFHDDGASLVLCDVAPLQGFDDGAADDVVRVPCDVTVESDVIALMRAADERHGRIDALLNVAGIADNKAGIEEINLAEWNRVVNVDLTGAFLCIKYALPLLRRSSAGAAIINMSSIGAIRPMAPGSGAYAASKGGLAALTRQLVVELGPQGITINSIAPGPCHAPMLARTSDEWKNRLLESLPAGRFGEAAEVAACAAYLAGDGARYISGQQIVVDGGITSALYFRRRDGSGAPAAIRDADYTDEAH